MAKRITINNEVELLARVTVLMNNPNLNAFLTEKLLYALEFGEASIDRMELEKYFKVQKVRSK